MTLASTISAPNLTLIRSGLYQAQQFVVACDNDTVVQFQPSANPSTSVYAEITVGMVASGSMSDVKSLMTVIYSTSTDYQATETYRTYVRKVSGTTTLYVGQTGQNLTTSMYVTVLNTYEIFEKPRVIRNSTQYVDWDVSFRRLLPVESDLATAYVLIDGETSWTPTANPQEMDNDATSTFTHAWESSNSNDSLDSGGTTASPSWTLEANSQRWIRYTFTDSNGNSNIRVIFVATVPKALDSVITLGFIGRDSTVANIRYAQGQGWTCDIGAIDYTTYLYISSIMKGSFVTIFSIEDINATRGSIESNIDFVGYLGYETITTRGDERAGVVSEARFVVNGFASKMTTASCPPLAPINDVTPTAWDEIEKPTPIRVITYLLTEHTTFLNLCALKFPSNHTSYEAPSAFLTSEAKLVSEAVSYQADGMNAYTQYGKDGILDISQNLVESDDTARNAADTVAALSPSDWINYTIEQDPDPTVRLLTVYAGVYSTSNQTFEVYRAFVPPVADVRGFEEPTRSNMILVADSNTATAQAEMAQRSANLYAALNPAVILRATLIDSWRFLQPDIGAWYTFTVAVTDTVRGISYDSNTRWQLIELDYTSNNRTGRKQVNALFRKETSNTGANIEVTKLETDELNQIGALPGVLPPFTDGDFELTEDWFDSLDPAPSTNPNPSSGDCEALGFRPKDGVGATTEQSSLNSENVSFQVSGSGQLIGGVDETYDFTSTNGGFVAVAIGEKDFDPRDVTSGSTGTHSPSTGWIHGDYVNDGGTNNRGVNIILDLGSIKTIDTADITLDFTKGTFANPANDAWRIGFSTASSVDGNDSSFTETILAEANAISTGNDQTVTYNAGTVEARFVNLRFLSSSGPSGYSGAVTLTDFVINGVQVNGDAFYYWTADTDPVAYASNEGLLFELTQPTSIPSYNAQHVYTVYENGVNSGPLLFEFESPYALSAMENWSLQIIACFLGT